MAENIEQILSSSAPRSVSEALQNWPTRNSWHPSPDDWRDEVFYFLLPDRFSDGCEAGRPMLEHDLATPAGVAAIRAVRGPGWNWDNWKRSGATRYQGGTLQGIRSKLGYLQNLGISTLWVGPVFRQRTELDTWHGYGIQNFLEIDPRFGTRSDLVELVAAAHGRGMRVVLDVIFNHSGSNWLYDESAGSVSQPPYRAQGGYDPLWQRNGYGAAIFDHTQSLGPDDSVWPRELQERANYVGAGSGSLGNGDINDPNAEFRRTDFCDLRKFNLDRYETLETLILAYQYWIALADVDGFRIDTFKHVSQEQARNFCNAIKEHAETLGKRDFFLVAEIAGGDAVEKRYLDISGRNLNACLDIGEQRDTIVQVSKGLSPGKAFFSGFSFEDGMGSHRNWGSRVLSISNDHDHVFGQKIRMAADASNRQQGAVAVALQLFSLGIPCLYYGTEQGLASGAEKDERHWLSEWGSCDVYLREAMFGPEHPRDQGWAGKPDPDAGRAGSFDATLPGFGAHGTSGQHVFNEGHPLYQCIARLNRVRQKLKALCRGRQYQREISVLGLPFGLPGAGELVAWARIFDDQEVLVVVNPHGNAQRGGHVVADHRLSRNGMRVVENTSALTAGMAPGQTLPLQFDGTRHYVALPALLDPSAVLVLQNIS